MRIIGAFLALAFSISRGSGLPSANSVTLSVTPATATVAAGGTVALQGTATGFTASPIGVWGVQESSTSPPVTACGTFPKYPLTFTECPNGYVVFGDVTQFPSPATYYAPAMPGTYHVVFTAHTEHRVRLLAEKRNDDDYRDALRRAGEDACPYVAYFWVENL
jgi:hypothetical protein